MKADKVAKNGCLLTQTSSNFTFNTDRVPSIKSKVILSMIKYIEEFGNSSKGRKCLIHSEEFSIRPWFYGLNKLDRRSICLLNRSGVVIAVRARTLSQKIF